MFWKRFLHDFGVANFAFVMPSLKQMKFSDAIEKGAALGYEETRVSYRGCAIGTAYRYRTGKLLITYLHRTTTEMRREVAEAFNIPYEIVARADRLHFQGMPRLQIAEMLRREGY